MNAHSNRLLAYTHTNKRLLKTKQLMTCNSAFYTHRRSMCDVIECCQPVIIGFHPLQKGTADVAPSSFLTNSHPNSEIWNANKILLAIMILWWHLCVYNFRHYLNTAIACTWHGGLFWRFSSFTKPIVKLCLGPAPALFVSRHYLVHFFKERNGVSINALRIRTSRAAQCIKIIKILQMYISWYANSYFL